MSSFSPQDEENKSMTNLFIFAVVVVGCMFVWQSFFAPPLKPSKTSVNSVGKINQTVDDFESESFVKSVTNKSTSSGAGSGLVGAKSVKRGFDEIEQFVEGHPTREMLISASSKYRIALENEDFMGSINLVGAQLDDLFLKKYNDHLGSSDPVVLLSPVGADNMYAIRQGWVPISGIGSDGMPDSKALWKIGNISTINSATNARLVTKNSFGQEFEVSMYIENSENILISQTIKNRGRNSITVQPFVLVRKAVNPKKSGKESFEGGIGYMHKRLRDITYKDIKNGKGVFDGSDPSIISSAPKDGNRVCGDWAGITDKYWLTAIIPSCGTKGHSFSFKMAELNEDAVGSLEEIKLVAKGVPIVVKPGELAKQEYTLFVGAKNIKVLKAQAAREGGPKLFVRAIDLGFFYFLTEPLLLLLSKINESIPSHNFGVSIVVLTILLRLLLFFPSKKSYISMLKMKKLDPQMREIKEKTKDNKTEQSKQLVELYRREKINPISGMVPMLLQIPFFIALYRILSIDIDLRHAVFIKGWINDLSAPDPTSIIGFLLGFAGITKVPNFLHIGVLPVLVGITMWVQQITSATSIDKDQERIMRLMPVILTFLFAGMPSGLLIYWVVSNLLGVVQQFTMKAIYKKQI